MRGRLFCIAKDAKSGTRCSRGVGSVKNVRHSRCRRLRRIGHLSEKLLGTLSSKITWQMLASIGRSNVGKLTILTPFIGYLVIFNPSFEQFFQSTLPAGSGPETSLLISLHDLRVYFLYFGLLLIGCGMIVFALLAPPSVRQFPTESSYIAEMESVKSPSLVVARFDELVGNFLKYNKGEARSPFFAVQHPSFPAAPSTFLHDLIAKLLTELPKVELPQPKSEEPYGSLHRVSPHAIPLEDGFITTDEVMERMFESGITTEMVYSQILRDQAVKFSSMVFFVDYVAANHSRFLARLWTYALYGFGFIFLLVPTVTTSLLVLASAYSSIQG